MRLAKELNQPGSKLQDEKLVSQILNLATRCLSNEKICQETGLNIKLLEKWCNLYKNDQASPAVTAFCKAFYSAKNFVPQVAGQTLSVAAAENPKIALEIVKSTNKGEFGTTPQVQLTQNNLFVEQAERLEKMSIAELGQHLLQMGKELGIKMDPKLIPQLNEEEVEEAELVDVE